MRNTTLKSIEYDDEDEFVLLGTDDLPLRPRYQHAIPSEETLSLDLQNISPHHDEVLISIRPPIEPRASLKHTPCDIVLVIDVSASMNTAADLPDAGRFESKESSGWSILDLVKHACGTILEHLNEQDRLAVITFSTVAKVVQGLLPMTEFEKKETSSRIEALTVQDCTNLWAGLREGLDIFTKTDSIGNAQGMYVLTDGVPNHLNPAQGFCKKLAPMLKELEDKKGQAPIVSTFGFGYYLKSSLLRSIAEVGRGSYSFIPDAGMIGTVFVHAVANLFSTYAINVELTIDCSNTSATIQSPSYLDFNTEAQLNTTKLRLGNVQYGQSRDIIMKISNATPADSLRATLHYQLPRGARNTLTVTKSLNKPCNIPQTTVDYHLSRHDLCSFLTSLATKSHSNEHVALQPCVIATMQDALRQLISTIEERVYASATTAANLADLTALLADLKASDDSSIAHGHGQIGLALQTSVSRPESNGGNITPRTSDSTYTPFSYSSHSLPRTSPPPPYMSSTYTGAPRAVPFYSRWGQHYLPSILHAHAYQLAMTFKDPGPLRYGMNSPLFVKCRDDLDDAFDRLSTPKPSLRRQYSGAGAGSIGGNRQTGYVQMQMSRFNRVDNPCFAGDCSVRYADGTRDLRVDEIGVGDVLWTAAGGRMVRDIVVTRVTNQEMIGIKNPNLDPASEIAAPGSEQNMLWITPWHPVFVDERWVFPEQLQGIERRVISGEKVYSFILEKDDDHRAHTIEVEGTFCVTLGHGLVAKRDTGKNVQVDVRAHPFFGDHGAVMESLERLEKDDCGRRTSGGIVKREADAGSILAYGFVGPDEAERIRSVDNVVRVMAKL